MSNSVYSLTRKAVKVTDEELAELEELAKGQMQYLSPLKMATMARQHQLGEYNLRVLECVRKLRDTIISGKNLQEGK